MNGEKFNDHHSLEMMKIIETKFKKDKKETGYIKCRNCNKGRVSYSISNRVGLFGECTPITGACSSFSLKFAGE